MNLPQPRSIGAALGVLALVAAVPAASPAVATRSLNGPTAEVGSTDIAVSTPPSVNYRIPDVAVTKAGTVLLTYDRRNGSDHDLPNDIDVLQRRSTDSGKTWSAPKTIVEQPSPTGCGDSSMVVDHNTGREFLFCTYSAGKVGFGSSRPGTSDSMDENTLHLQVRHSDDDGQTWSAPSDLNPQVKNPGWRGYFSSSGHGIQTSDGRLVQPAVLKDGAATIHSINIYSEDHGATWHAGEPLPPNTDESKAVELNNGKVIQNSRPDVGGYRLLSTSMDGGRTFTPAKADPALPDPHVNGDEIRVDPSPRNAHESWLLFTNAADQRERDHLTLRLSCDNGATWPARKTLNTGPSGYAATAMLPDGRVGVFTETGSRSSAEKLTFTTVNVNDLASGCQQ